MIRRFAALLILAVSACTSAADLKEAPADLGNFRLGHNVVVASKMQQSTLSRDATEDEWKTALTAAVDERFGRYEGDRLYHIGISVEGFSIAPPGVPLIVSPKSVLIIRATIWDDTLGRKLNEEAKQFTVFESLSSSTIVGSGLTQTKEQQMTNLSQNAAKMIQNWMLDNPEWFPGIGATDPVSDPALTPASVTEDPEVIVTEG